MQNNKILNDTVEQLTLDNGLKCNFISKKDFAETFAVLTTNFGSIDEQFSTQKDSKIDIPAGTAHFLEHKMFSNEGYDSFDRFTELGANANAFTSNTQTSYLFSTVANFADNLDELFKMVLTPYFSVESVAKEQGIIGQEIDMYKDSPSQQLYGHLMENLYPGTPLAKDIAGTRKSIAEITPEILYKIHDTFYQLDQMTLTLVGNIPGNITELVNEFISKYYRPKSDAKLLKRLGKMNLYGNQVNLPTAFKYNVINDKFLFGWKINHNVSFETDNRIAGIKLEIVLEMLFGSSSATFQRLYDDQIIDDSFSYSVNVDRAYINVMINQNPILDNKELFTLISKLLCEFKNNEDINQERFNIIRNVMISDDLFKLNSCSEIGYDLSNDRISETNIYEEIDILNNLSLKDVVRNFEDSLNDNMTSVTMWHKNEE